LGLLMPHSSAQILCCHWDLGRLEGVCGEAGGGGYVRQAPSQPMKKVPKDLGEIRPGFARIGT